MHEKISSIKVKKECILRDNIAKLDAEVMCWVHAFCIVLISIVYQGALLESVKLNPNRGIDPYESLK